MKFNSTKLACFAMYSLVLFIASCDQGNDRLKEKADIESKVISQNQIDAEMSHLTQRSKEMEADLLERQRFYKSVSGTYEGKLNNGYHIKITLASRLPYYPPQRIRILEEIASDLSLLGFNAQVIQWLPKSSISATGCKVEMIKPDLINGEIIIASDNCPNFYKLKIASKDSHSRSSDESANLASDIRTNEYTEEVPYIYGEVLPLHSPDSISFDAIRKNK